jgi:hypothetical protein
MYFAIDGDYGHSISGWIVLDNPSVIPEITIRIPNREPITLKANVLRPDLKDHGLHSTGLAGFQIDGSLIDGIDDLPQITLFEEESGLPIFRRNFHGAAVEKKILLMEVGAFPQVKLLRHMMSLFDLCYPAIERFSLETATSIVGCQSESLIVTGRPNWQRHGGLLQEKGFLTTALLRDPFEELAERLLTIAQIKKWAVGEHPMLKQHSPLLSVLDGIDFNDDKSILRSFRKLSPEQHNLLRSPMTSALGCLPEEEVQRKSVGIALDNLARFDLVATREQLSEFWLMFDSMIGMPTFADFRLETLPGVPEMRDRLRGIGLVADLLDEDVALYSFASEAVNEAFRKMREDGADVWPKSLEGPREP